jgi:hypothetical protein
MSALPRLGDAPHYTTVRTLLIDTDGDRQVAWIDGALWPPDGASVELYGPKRDAQVVGSRLVLSADGGATVFVYLRISRAEQYGPRAQARRRPEAA